MLLLAPFCYNFMQIFISIRQLLEMYLSLIRHILIQHIWITYWSSKQNERVFLVYFTSLLYRLKMVFYWKTFSF